MKIINPILAQAVFPPDVIPAGRHWLGFSLKELMILLGAVAIVSLILVVWAAFVRKTPRRHSHHHHHDYSAREENNELRSEETGSAEGEEGRRYRRKRRRRREHRPRNPTLAETGGLPPLRADQPQDPLP
jgi:FtsZ-interacting cell division protein ZipA